MLVSLLGLPQMAWFCWVTYDDTYSSYDNCTGLRDSAWSLERHSFNSRVLLP